MKRFLLIAGDGYYPSQGTDDWKGCFETREDAAQMIEQVRHFRKITKGKNKGEEEYTHSQYRINGDLYDWYNIVDLREWME